jgi:hypothetical protein
MEQQIETSGAVAEVAIAPRLTVVLHPNESRIDIVLNDRMFNRERYTHTREQVPEGAEKQLLDSCDFIVGIESAKASKNTLALEISDGMYLSEFIPRVIDAIKQWGSATEPYEPAIYVDNRRWAVEPTYDSEYGQTSCGLRQSPTEPAIGLPYAVWASA